MDLKVILRSHKGHKYILCIIDEVTNYLITVPILQAKSEEIGEALFAMALFLDHHCGYDTEMIQTVYYYMNADTFGMMPIRHYS